jgi:hypothetical protein
MSTYLGAWDGSRVALKNFCIRIEQKISIFTAQITVKSPENEGVVRPSLSLQELQNVLQHLRMW